MYYNMKLSKVQAQVQEFLAQPYELPQPATFLFGPWHLDTAYTACESHALSYANRTVSGK